jgi:signal transduction histidine kinase
MTPSATILNVDDYLPARYARSRVLREAGFRVIEAGTGEEALELVARERPDVVLVDHHLPDMTGLEVCRRIKDAPETSSLPVLQLSATAKTVELKVEAMNVGADTYLIEPIAPAELVAHVNAALRYRRAEERLLEFNQRVEALYEEARQANRAKDEFLAVLSHELRTPLNAMLGWLQLLRGGRLDTAHRESALEIIERNAVAQARLIEDLIDVSRIVSGQLLIHSKRIDLVPILRTAASMVTATAGAKGLQLEVRTGCERAMVDGDPVRLQQIMVNVLSNAIKFTDRGSVAVSLECRERRVILEVRDTGIGIDPEFLPHVFDRFRQADSSKTRPHGGLGLGLAITRHLIEAHGGRVSAASEGRGRGATFTLELPLAPELDETPLDRGPAVAAGDRPLEGQKVLLVEDDTDSREMMTLVLQHCGATVLPAATAVAALELLADRPDLVVADVGLPTMDGYSMLREVRRRGIRAPALALTGYASSEDRAQALDAGFDDHLGKPVTPEQLVEVLARLGLQAKR